MSDDKILGLVDVYNEVRALTEEVRGLAGELRSDAANQRTDVALLQRDRDDLRKDVDELKHARDTDAATRTKNRWTVVALVVSAFVAPYLLSLLHLTGK